MANKYKAEVEILLDKPRILRFTHNAMAEMEDEFGDSLLGEEFFSNISVSKVRKLLRMALKHDIKDLTLEEAGELMEHADSLTYVMQKVIEAYTLIVTGDEGEKKQKKQGKTKSGTGKSI